MAGHGKHPLDESVASALSVWCFRLSTASSLPATDGDGPDQQPIHCGDSPRLAKTASMLELEAELAATKVLLQKTKDALAGVNQQLMDSNATIIDLRAQLSELHPAIACAADYVNARGVTPADRLRDVPSHVHEIALHGVRTAASTALAATQAYHQVRLAGSLNPTFMEEYNDNDLFEDLENFDNDADVVANVIHVGDVLPKVFDDE